MLPDKGQPPSPLQGTDQTVSQLCGRSDKGSCSRLPTEASSCLCRQAVTRGATQGQRRGADGSPDSYKAGHVLTQAHASPAPRGRLSFLSWAPFCAGRSEAAHQAAASGEQPAPLPTGQRRAEPPELPSPAGSPQPPLTWASPSSHPVATGQGPSGPAPLGAAHSQQTGGLIGSQRLSVQHLPGSWQRGCSLSEAAPKLHQPQRACIPSSSPTGCTFWTWYFISPVRREHIPSAATPAPGTSRTKTPLRPPSCSSPAGAGTSPWHQDTSQLIWHVNERAPTAC